LIESFVLIGLKNILIFLTCEIVFARREVCKENLTVFGFLEKYTSPQEEVENVSHIGALWVALVLRVCVNGFL